MSDSPTARTLELCRKLGLKACVVEKWIPQTRRRLDAFGFGDILALDHYRGAVLLQATSGSNNVALRVRKIRAKCAELAKAWLEHGNRIFVVGWAKRGPRGKPKRWTPRFVELVLEGEQIEQHERAELAPTKARTEART